MVNVTHTLDVAEILRPPIQWVSQKFCNHSYTGCIRNYAAIYTLGVVEILRPFIQWMWQKFCNDSYTGCCRNSATTHTLDVAEILRPLILISGFYTETTTESKKSETVYYFLQSAFQPKGRTKLALLRYNLTDSKTLQSHKLNYFIKQRVILLT